MQPKRTTFTNSPLVTADIAYPVRRSSNLLDDSAIFHLLQPLSSRFPERSRDILVGILLNQFCSLRCFVQSKLNLILTPGIFGKVPSWLVD